MMSNELPDIAKILHALSEAGQDTGPPVVYDRAQDAANIAREAPLVRTIAMLAADHDPDTCAGTDLFPPGWCVGEKAAGCILLFREHECVERALALTLIMLGRYLKADPSYMDAPDTLDPRDLPT